MKMQGVGASSGVALAKVFKLELAQIEIKQTKIKANQTVAEIAKVKKAIATAIKQIAELKKTAAKKLGEAEASVFDAHMQVADDPSLITEIEAVISNESLNALAATQKVTDSFAAIFAGMEDEYMKAREADVRDVARRILLVLANKSDPDLTAINEAVIIVAHDLTPSETAQLNAKYVRGFLTSIGGRTSHASIMARSLEIPAVVGLGQITSKVKTDDLVAFDGTTGEVIIKPTAVEQKAFLARAEQAAIEKRENQKYLNKKSQTRDGKSLDIAANIGSPRDLAGVVENGAEGIGLFRSEFLYMDAKDWPTEEEQYEAYATVVKGTKGHLTTIRTLDIGGDKKLNYFEFPHEMNPFLGYRAIRLSLDKKPMFRTQLRALIRASVHGDLAIMFPMVATVNEFLAAKKEYEKARAELIAQKVPVANKILVGMMVEIPAAAVIADRFAEHADFLSIGTNDLMQYTFAADRMSEKVAYLYQPLNPAILQLINMTIKGGHKHKRFVSMCGEMAGDPQVIPLLVGMGLDEYSMSATSILGARRQIAQIDSNKAAALVEKALNASTQEEVAKLIKAFNKKP